MSSCEEVQGLVANWLDDEIGESDLRRMLTHVEICSTCSAHYERARSLRNDVRVLAQCADHVAASPMVQRKWRLVGLSRIAAAIFIAIGIGLAARFLRHQPEIAQQIIVKAPVLEDRRVIHVADASEVVLAHPSHEMAVQFESKRSDVRIVWLYSPIPEINNTAPTTAPQS